MFADLQALFTLEGGPKISEEDGAYCRAKARLPLSEFPRALAASAKVAGQKAPALALLQGRPLKAVDGSTLTLADTNRNRRAYPALQCADIPSFPMMHLVVLFCLASGAVLALAQGSWNDSDCPCWVPSPPTWPAAIFSWEIAVLVVIPWWPSWRTPWG